MKEVAKVSLNRMGRLNNQLVAILDKTDATPIEVLAVLHQFITIIERYFEVSTRPKPTQEKK